MADRLRTGVADLCEVGFAAPARETLSGVEQMATAGGK